MNGDHEYVLINNNYSTIYVGTQTMNRLTGGFYDNGMGTIPPICEKFGTAWFLFVMGDLGRRSPWTSDGGASIRHYADAQILRARRWAAGNLSPFEQAPEDDPNVVRFRALAKEAISATPTQVVDDLLKGLGNNRDHLARFAIEQLIKLLKDSHGSGASIHAESSITWGIAEGAAVSFERKLEELVKRLEGELLPVAA